MNDPRAIPIVVSKFLVGAKQAVRVGDGAIAVSPAMFELISNADDEELEKLLNAIPVLQLPDYRLDMRSPMPMTTMPPEVKS